MAVGLHQLNVGIQISLYQTSFSRLPLCSLFSASTETQRITKIDPKTFAACINLKMLVKAAPAFTFPC